MTRSFPIQRLENRRPALSRRALVRVLPAVLLTALLSGPVCALAVSPPMQALENSVSRVLSLVRNPDYVNPATRTPLKRQIEDEVYHIFDFGEFSARTVGQAWRTFTPDQRKAFTDAFAQLLFATYLNNIDGYDGEQVRYTGEITDPSGQRVEIRTELTLGDGKVLPIDYRMLPKNGSWVVYDVVVEGLSLVMNYRTQFQDILATAKPDQLIEKVRAKAAEVEQSHAR